ncbi:MAG: DNA polymerase III subunit gamma/tau [Magnetococcales bacterium]|nr:DNA polymerase III subunit gamma/tau [Magnetococcales bacterium]
MDPSLLVPVQAGPFKAELMSAYLVLARKWRPQGFSTLIGQEHVTRSLVNALESGRLAHAFLFTGIRGVGKTTLARILAMCLNCQTGTTSTPCGVCDSCREIRTGNHPDVLEIDAASRTRVDQMREVLEMVRYTPASSRYKVYILDEVHMLTSQSFNALLKTLEEPPGHVKFICATTEPRRIPATILSRCQRYELKRVARDVMTHHLAAILAQESVTWDERGLAAVVRAADGSVRDALSILDQAIAHGNGAVQFENVRHLLGLTDQDAVAGLLEAITTGAGEQVLYAVQTLFAGGVEPTILVNDLLALLHQGARGRVLRQNNAQENRILDLEPVPPCMEALSMEQMQMLYQVLLRGRSDLAVADTPYQALEMLLLRATYLRQAPDLRKLVLQLAGDAGTGEKTGQEDPAPPPTRTPDRPGNLPHTAEKSVAKTSKPATQRGENRIGDKPALASWDDFLALATRKSPSLARRLGGQVACLEFQPGEGGIPEAVRLRLTNDCFGPPIRIQQMVTEFLLQQGCGGTRIVVEDASAATCPESWQETQDRQKQEHRQSFLEKIQEHPIVHHLMDMFQAEIVAVQTLENDVKHG